MHQVNLLPLLECDLRDSDGSTRKAISVRGVVQGVGFRPFVYRLAHEHGLTGWVLNHSGGVEIEVEGPPPALAAFVRDLEARAPPLARIESVQVADAPPAGCTTFEIRHSVAEEGRYQLISPDVATCPDCLRELLDPVDRRYRYPFTNCTNCGPCFTIIADIPYDRPLTTMRDFTMCPQCQAEYDDPLDRRCPVCTAAAGGGRRTGPRPAGAGQPGVARVPVNLAKGFQAIIDWVSGYARCLTQRANEEVCMSVQYRRWTDGTCYHRREV